MPATAGTESAHGDDFATRISVIRSPTEKCAGSSLLGSNRPGRWLTSRCRPQTLRLVPTEHTAPAVITATRGVYAQRGTPRCGVCVEGAVIFLTFPLMSSLWWPTVGPLCTSSRRRREEGVSSLVVRGLLAHGAGLVTSGVAILALAYVRAMSIVSIYRSRRCRLW